MIVQGLSAYGFLVLLMAIDVTAGLLKAIKQKSLKSDAIRDGLLKKSGTLLALILSYVLDLLVNNGSSVFQTMMMIMAICNESLSIIENLSFLGVPFPKGIMNRLDDLKDKLNETATPQSATDKTKKERIKSGIQQKEK
ncbi:phage holin family protein [Sporolactobacillus shoreicorticis]|uniref:Phage holin family protein n=1 Tax=Sporolactobacillus shoreicorticis TaxID=1923877 RepID=A0ABW5S7U6_9BACL|nr:phage holin family protein [Sporolactobacillus shoreicorticis]MCO7126042.1 phage holin family protein [Sporolactobacillus shoreicorticis]